MFPPRFFCSWVTAWVKTPSRWDGEDRILHTEFNDNWDKIDTAIKGSADKAAALYQNLGFLCTSVARGSSIAAGTTMTIYGRK